MGLTLDLPKKLESQPKTGAELLAYWRREEVIGSRPEIADGLEHARTIRRKAEKRSRGAERSGGPESCAEVIPRRA